MALRLKKSVFIHVPKTGGTWVTMTLKRMGVIKELTKQPHMSWNEIRADRKMGAWHPLKPFAFVRHPLPWFRSYWAYKIRCGWEDGDWLDRECKDNDFRKFIENCVSRHPGLLGRMYAQFTEGVPFVGRYERLREDLIQALSRNGEGFNVQMVRDATALNVSAGLPHYARATEYPPDLLKAILESEADTMKTWGYEGEGV